MTAKKMAYTPYQERELEERRFNAWQQRVALTNADAAYRALYVGWAPLVIGIGIASVYRPAEYDLAALMVILYCFCMNVVSYTLTYIARRTTERYVCKLFTDQLDEWEKIRKNHAYAVEYFHKHQPYLKGGDPPLAQCIHCTMGRFGFPKRGSGHAIVFSFHVVTLLACTWMFAVYLWTGDVQVLPALFWKWCAIVVFASLCNMLANFWFLFTTRFFLATVDTVVALRGGRLELHRMAGSTHSLLLLNTIVDLMDRSPRLFACLAELRHRLETNPDDVDSIYNEFTQILMRSPRLIAAFNEWHKENNPSSKER